MNWDTALYGKTRRNNAKKIPMVYKTKFAAELVYMCIKCSRLVANKLCLPRKLIRKIGPFLRPCPLSLGWYKFDPNEKLVRYFQTTYKSEDTIWGHLTTRPLSGWCNFNPTAKLLRLFLATQEANFDPLYAILSKQINLKLIKGWSNPTYLKNILSHNFQ